MEKVKVVKQIIQFIDEIEKVCNKHGWSFWASISNGCEELIINDFDKNDIENLKKQSVVLIYNGGKYPIDESTEISRLVSEHYKRKDDE